MTSGSDGVLARGHICRGESFEEGSHFGYEECSQEAVVLTLAEYERLKRIAAAVLEEREAIAAMFDTDEATYGYECDNKMIAAAIRARGETK